MTSNPKDELLPMLTREERFNRLHEQHFEAVRRYGLGAAGTVAHSFIEAFSDEEDAFTAFTACALDFPRQNGLPGRYL